MRPQVPIGSSSLPGGGDDSTHLCDNACLRRWGQYKGGGGTDRDDCNTLFDRQDWGRSNCSTISRSGVRGSQGEVGLGVSGVAGAAPHRQHYKIRGAGGAGGISSNSGYPIGE